MPGSRYNELILKGHFSTGIDGVYLKKPEFRDRVETLRTNLEGIMEKNLPLIELPPTEELENKAMGKSKFRMALNLFFDNPVEETGLRYI